jgi:ubiquinone/menaquinone biosynthesis C-methylase UbiE
MAEIIQDTQEGNFNELWKARPAEVDYIHWTRGEPENQIQLAFRSHWNLFKELMGEDFKGRRVLELGCGRGSISAYFADAGFDCTLMDISPSAIEAAKRIFGKQGLSARFEVGDAYETGLPDSSFDVIVSIGLLEHMEDLHKALAEEVRLLDKGGLLLAYVVPENLNNVQKGYNFVCEILSLYDRALSGAKERVQKPYLYRSDEGSDRYLEILSQMPMSGLQASGVYPLPMISPSPSFPFTLMPPPMEQELTRHFQGVLKENAEATGKNGWLCDESYGQAFLVWGWKE